MSISQIARKIQNLIATVAIVDELHIVEYTLEPGDFALYTAPSNLSWTVIIDDIDYEDGMAYIFYTLEDGTEMTGWVSLNDLNIGGEVC